MGDEISSNRQIEISKYNILEKPFGNIWSNRLRKLRRNVEGFGNFEKLEGRSCLLIYNHLAIQDGLFIYDILSRELGLHDYRFTIPASIKFWDGRMKFLGARGLMEKLRVENEIKFLQVVQTQDKTYTPEKKNEINRTMINSVADDLTNTNKIVLFSPEGGRSPGGSMQKAQRGVEIIMGLVPQDTHVMNVALWGSEQVVPYKRIALPNPRHITQVRFTEPMTVEEVYSNSDKLDIEPRDYLMCRFTDELPRQYWGVYNPDRFPRYFEERVR